MALGQTPEVTPLNQAAGSGAEPANQTAETERIIVTGSNIPTAEEVGPNPVQTIDRAFIEKGLERFRFGRHSLLS